MRKHSNPVMTGDHKIFHLFLSGRDTEWRRMIGESRKRFRGALVKVSSSFSSSTFSYSTSSFSFFESKVAEDV